MNKRQKKKHLKKHNYKHYRKRLSKCKNYNDLFKLIYPAHIIKKLIYKTNPFVELFKREENAII